MKTEHKYIYRYAKGLIVAVRVPGHGQVQKRFPASQLAAAIEWRDARLAEAEALGRSYEPTASELLECRALGVSMEGGRMFRLSLGRRDARVQRCFSFRKYGGVRPAFQAAMAARVRLQRKALV